MNRDCTAARLGLSMVVMVGVVAFCVGCSSSTSTSSGTGTSSSAATATPNVGATPPNQTPTSSPNTNPATVAADPTFIGHWHVHGATMDINATNANIGTSAGPCAAPAQGMCHETDTLTVTSSDPAQLTLTVTAVSFADKNGTNASNPSPGSSTAVGDSLQLKPQAPGLLKATILHGFPAWVGGNPYWCGQGISPSDTKLCGA